MYWIRVLIAWLLSATAFLGVSKLLPGFRIGSFGTALAIRLEAIEEIQHAAAESPGAIPADVLHIFGQDDDGATRHVFAGIIPDPLDHRRGTTVTDHETQGGLAADVHLTTGGAVARGHPHHRGFVGRAGEINGRSDDDQAAVRHRVAH